MAWDQSYYQDPNQYYDPNYGYSDPAWGYEQEPQEDTESEKLRKDQEEKERLEALQSNRLFLKKVKKQCVKEDFADLEKLQLFLFEVLIESLEVNSDSSLGLLKDKDVSFVSARVRFLNSPYMEICETGKDKKSNETQRGTFTETDYFEKLNEAGFQHTKLPSKDPSFRSESISPSGEHSSRKSGVSVEEEAKINTKWDNANGKSCLFSMTPLMMINDLDNYPVILQVVRCGLSEDEKELYEPVGYAQFRLPEEFGLSILQSCKTGVILPVSSVHRDICDIKNVFGVKKGKVEVFIRLSSFGPVIITSFQTTGPDRKYVFKPSPMSSNFKELEENDSVPQSQLKPIIAEEDNTVGVTVLNNFDEFQVPVIWKSKKGMCDFGGSLSSTNDVGSVRVTSIGSLRLPLSSQLSLCRDVQPPGNFKRVNMGEPVCDWHNLVGAAVTNSPGGNCGCIPTKPNTQYEPSSKYKSEPCCNKLKSNVPQDMKMPLKETLNVSKPAKMVLPVKGDFLKSDDSDCGCNCPEIREYLKAAKRTLK